MKSDTASRPVRRWLCKLDRELTKLPPGRAHELRVDLTAHLDEVVSPEAPDAEVAEILAQLGDPAELVNEALDGSKPRRRLERVRVRTWVLLGITAALIISCVTMSLVFVSRYAFAPELDLCCGSRVVTHGKLTDASVGDQDFTVVADSAGHRLALYADIQNQSSVTQTILGIPADFRMWQYSKRHLRFAVSTNDPTRVDENYSRLRFTTHAVSVGPGQSRTLRMSDLTTCGFTEQALDSIPLRVRVGWFTRTETLELDSPLVFKPTHGCGFSK